MTTRSFAVAALVVVCATGALAAPEQATDAERTYGELRVAKDAKLKLMADRWYNLIRLQEWNDLSGRFSTTAKYVEHDPDLAWVKLRVIKGTGANRVVKDVTIPVAKLSKTCQSRVRQISVLREKVIAAAAKVGKEKAEDEKSVATGEMDAGRGEEPPPREGIALHQPGDDDFGRRGEPLPGEETAAPPEASAPVDHMPLPRQMPPLPTPAATPPAAVAPVADDRAQGDTPSVDSPTDDRATAEAVAPANLPDDDAPWRTSYDAFRENFTIVDGGRMGPQLDWGQLEQLKQLQELIMNAESITNVQTSAEIEKRLKELGEFQWEATLTDAPIEEGSWTKRLGLPPLPEPLNLHFLLDDFGGRNVGSWQNLKAGDRVRFVGRFLAFESSYDILVAIRFPELGVMPAADASGSPVVEPIGESPDNRGP